jgi:large subunit ribosomal protein L28
MSRVCELTGVGPTTGNKVSHSNIKTRTRWLPNLKTKKYFIPELGQTVSLKLSAKAIRTVDKQGGISQALKEGKDCCMSDRLLGLKNKLINKNKVNK